MRITKIENAKVQSEVVSGFLGGLNTFQDDTGIKDSELTEAKNILLEVDGISIRPGSVNYGSPSGTRLLGGFPFYKSDGTRQFLRFTQGANSRLQRYVNGVPTDIGAITYANVRMNFVQARDKVFIFNGQDNLSFYDGSTITTYTALPTPTGLAVATQGTTGTTAYSYRVNAFNVVGETLAAVSVGIANGNASLNATNYNKLTWNAVAGATGYNVYGRYGTGLGETYMATVYTTIYEDKGQDEPSLSLLPPEANTTEGIKGSMAVFAISRIFSAGDPDNPSRLRFGGTADQIGNFSASSIGGGGVDVFKNDGAVIRAILPFQGGVIVWKDNAIYKFSFTQDGAQQLEEITRSFGGISFRSCKHVENDVIFAAKKDGRLAFYSLGNQENYTASVLRTNELSIKIADKLRDVNLGNLPHAAAFYYNNIYGCAIPTEGSSVNDRIWCLDTRFGAWVYWEGMQANFFTEYTDEQGNQKLYAGSDSSGHMVEMFRDVRMDNTSAIDVRWVTKSFNQKLFHKYKKYFSPIFQFKDVSKAGTLKGEIYVDGSIFTADFTVNQQTQGGAGFGAYLPGFHLFGEAPGGEVVAGLSADIPVEAFMVARARSIKYVFRSKAAADVRYKFLSLANTYRVLDGKQLPSESRIYAS